MGARRLDLTVRSPSVCHCPTPSTPAPSTYATHTPTTSARPHLSAGAAPPQVARPSTTPALAYHTNHCLTRSYSEWLRLVFRTMMDPNLAARTRSVRGGRARGKSTVASRSVSRWHSGSSRRIAGHYTVYVTVNRLCRCQRQANNQCHSSSFESENQ